MFLHYCWYFVILRNPSKSIYIKVVLLGLGYITTYYIFIYLCDFFLLIGIFWFIFLLRFFSFSVHEKIKSLWRKKKSFWIFFFIQNKNIKEFARITNPLDNFFLSKSFCSGTNNILLVCKLLLIKPFKLPFCYYHHNFYLSPVAFYQTSIV